MYPLVPLIGVSAYIPQLWSIIKEKTCVKSFSLAPWKIWLLSSFLAFGYSWFYLGDVMSSVTCALHMAFQIAVILKVYYKRSIRKDVKAICVRSAFEASRAFDMVFKY